MNIQVRDYNRLRTVEPFFCPEPGNDLGRQEVSADGDLWLVLFQKLDERAGVEPVPCKSLSFVLPGLIQVIVEPAQDLRCAVDHLKISFGVQPAKDHVRVIQSIHMSHLTRCTHLHERFFNG